MIVRTYGRRSRSMTTRNFNGGGGGGGGSVSGKSFSQESPQDVFDFTFSSQGSNRWSSSDPYNFSDSLEDPYGLNDITTSSQVNVGDEEDDDLRILPEYGGFDDGVFRAKKVKIGDLEPYKLNSSPDSDELTILSSKNGRLDGDFGFRDLGFGKSMDLEPYSLSSSQESDELAILPAKTSKQNGKLDGVFRKSKKVKEIQKKKSNKKGKNKEMDSDCVTVGTTATLMETQEFGEMMEHVDEVNFALDGLKKGQPVRVRRGSLLSLLSVCGSAQQRRLLRAHGMAKTIIDAVLGLSFDDSPSNLAAAALFYILTSDGQDDRLLDSPVCIRFLMKLLKPLTFDTANVKVPSFGSKLLAIRMDPDIPQISAKASESSAAIMQKVQEILINSKDLNPRDVNDNCIELPELNPKWISLLTMEKACFSTISIEDVSGRVRRTGGNFKEKLRELGGLNAVFEVARNCHSVMEGWLQKSPTSVLDSKDKEGHENMALLLKCLKIMENATFLSKDNQSHLLGMKGNLDSQSAPRSFTKLILGVIKILSGIAMLRSSLSSHKGTTCSQSNETSHASSEFRVKDNGTLPISCSTRCTMEGTSSLKSLSISQDSQSLTSSHLLSSKSHSGTSAMSDIDPWLKMRVDFSTSGQCTETSGGFTNGTVSKGVGVGFSRDKDYKVSSSNNLETMEDSQDPFAFDDDEFEPSKWDLLSGREKAPRVHNNRAKPCQPETENQSLLLLDQEESHLDGLHSSEVSCSSGVTDEKSNLLADCLLSSVKVLMNLTNDNPMGCEQIAACGGLETLSTLIASHFPNFHSYLPSSGSSRENGVFEKSAVVGHQNEKHLTDEELDLLVAILGLLVNLVEKDSRNRSRLATIQVLLPNLEGLEKESSTDLIPLLCSIFLANQGAGEAASEGRQLSWDDEDALLQEEKEAEKMILEAYAALLLAFLSTERRIRNTIADCLPDHNLKVLVPVLERFVEFHLSLDMMSPETHKTVLEVIESCRIL